MSANASDVQDDIDAALRARAAQGAANDSGSDDIDAALRARAKGALAPSSGSPNPKRASYADQALEAGSGLFHSIVGGYKGIYTGVTTGDLDKAAQAVQDEQSKTYVAPKNIDVLPLGMSPKAYAAWESGATMHNTSQELGDLAEAHGASPLVSTLASVAPTAAATMFGAGRMAPEAGSAQAAVDAATSSRSMGAAGAKVNVSDLTPETQTRLAEIDAKGGKVNTTALANHAEAETLPVPVRLTQGQALENESIKTNEFNSKQQQPEIGKRFDEQDEALKENLETFHREAAPTAVGNDIPTNDQAMIDSLKRYDAPKKQAITDAYNAAKEANGGDLQMDGSKFAETAETALKPQSKSRFLPSSVQGIIDDVKTSGGKMSLDDFEGYRTTLANEVSKAKRAGDGNAVAAINKVRDALEDTPPAGDASAAAKAAYDKARGLAKARFSEMNADPAYEAAVGDETPAGELSDQAGKFGNKYVLAGVKANLQRLRAKLDTEGQEAMTSTGYGVLKDKAGLAKDKFIQNGYNTALDSMRSKGVAEELLGGSDNVENAAKLGRVARKVQTFSRGSAPNTSGTLTGALAKEGINTLRMAAPEGVNKGLDILGGHLAKRSAAKNLIETLRPGAGLED